MEYIKIIKEVCPAFLFIIITTGYIGYSLCDVNDPSRGIVRFAKSGLVCYMML